MRACCSAEVPAHRRQRGHEKLEHQDGDRCLQPPFPCAINRIIHFEKRRRILIYSIQFIYVYIIRCYLPRYTTNGTTGRKQATSYWNLLPESTGGGCKLEASSRSVHQWRLEVATWLENQGRARAARSLHSPAVTAVLACRSQAALHSRQPAQQQPAQPSELATGST